jgi:hypothetical protein
MSNFRNIRLRGFVRERGQIIAAGLMIVLMIVSLVAAAVALAQPPPPQAASSTLPVRAAGGSVHGSIHATLKGRKVYLVDFPVFLVRTSNNAQNPPKTTDRFGRYYLQDQPAGDYKLCWSAPGWVPGCAKQLVRIRGNATYFLDQEVVLGGSPTAGLARTAVWGRVNLEDGSSAAFAEPYFEVVQDAKVTAVRGRTVATARANVFGDYVIPNLQPGTYKVTATAPGVQVTQQVAAGQSNPLALQLPNRRPLLYAVVAHNGSSVRREVPADAKLRVTADVRDLDDDRLNVIWKPAPFNGDVVSPDGAEAVWKLDGTPGLKTLYVLVSDGRGGYARGQVTVAAGASTANFTARLVDDVTGAPVVDAVVTVNGQTATRSGGVFISQASLADRYVVNVSAPKYVLMSRVFDHANVFQEIRLVRAALSTVDAAGDIRLVDTRKDLRRFGYVNAAPASIHIKAGTLRTLRGATPSGRLSAEIAALDVSSAQFPGDNGALVDGRDIGLVSYGAMHVELRDANGNRLTLADGATAEVTIPVPVAQKNPPSQIPLWSYDEASGFWTPLDTKAVFDPTRRVYTGVVPHLSAFNVDLDLPDLACMRVLLDNANSNQLQGRVTHVAGPTFFAPQGPFPLWDALNVIKRLPPNSTVHLQVTDNASNPVPGLILLDGAQHVVASGDFPTGPATLPHFPPTPYANCTTVSVRITDLSGPIGTIPFLSQYTFGDIGDSATTSGYYLALDAAMTYDAPTHTYSGGTHSTLGDWWQQAGFGADGLAGGGASQAYLNDNDLGLGRSMHIRQAANGDVFAYVTNYGNPDQSPQNAIDALNQNAAVRGATVAMESTGASHIVKFFVYAGLGGGANAKLVESANLDGFGDKFVPQLCETCHGGEPYFTGTTPTPQHVSLRNGGLGAVFREFDLATYIFPGGSTPGDIAAVGAADRAQFHELNQLVIASGTQPNISDLINGFYGLGAGNFDTAWAPATWQAPAAKLALYQNVVAKSCRTCHVAFDPTGFGSFLDWQHYDQFEGARFNIDSRVCGTEKIMPHALITYRNFWLGNLGGTYEPAALAGYSAPGWAPLGQCK